MKILVTGGAGFIGSHVVDMLLEKGHEVVVIDNLANSSTENVNKDAVFYRHDINSPETATVFGKESPECLIHLAAQISLQNSIQDPVNDATQNIMGSLRLFELCKKHGTGKIIFASSAAVYGEPSSLPVKESHETMPFYPYGISKMCVERYMEHYARNFGMKCIALRYANVYGPRQSGGEAGVIPKFIKSMLEGKKPVIYGKGDHTRDFVFVKDVAKATLLAAEKDAESSAFNIASGREKSIMDIFNAVRKELNSETGFENSAEISEIGRIFFDISMAEKELGWKPEISFESGIKQTADYFRYLQANP